MTRLFRKLRRRLSLAGLAVVIIGPLSLASCQSKAGGLQTPPPVQPAVMGIGVISRPDRHEFCATMSSDRQTVYAGIEHGRWQSIIAYDWRDGGWAGPRPVLGTPDLTAQDPFLARDDTRLYFITRARGDADIAYAEILDDGWSEPVFLPAPVNSRSNEYFISLTQDDRIVFASDRAATAPGDFDIYLARNVGDAFSEPTALPSAINTPHYEGDPFIDPEGRYLIFASNRPGGRGRGDFYLSIAENDGWSQPIAFDQRINTTGHELCPLVTTDGSTFLFTRGQDIYMVSAQIIEEMIDAHREQQDKNSSNLVGR